MTGPIPKHEFNVSKSTDLQLQKLQDELSASQRVAQKLQGELPASQRVVQKLEGELSASKRVAQKLQGELSASQRLVQKLEGELSASKRTALHIEQSKERLQGELFTSQRLVQELEGELSTSQRAAQDHQQSEEWLQGELSAMTCEHEQILACQRQNEQDTKRYADNMKPVLASSQTLVDKFSPSMLNKSYPGRGCDKVDVDELSGALAAVHELAS